MKHAFRQLTKSPGYAIISILIVAIGIGAVTTMFSTVSAVILRPFHLPAPERLVAVFEDNLAHNLSVFQVSAPNYADWRDRSQSFQSLAAVDWRAKNLTGHGEPEHIAVRGVTANFLSTFGVNPKFGRDFLSEEDRPGGAQVAIVTERFARSHFANRVDVVGQILLFDNAPYTVVGVIGDDLPLAGPIAVMVPMAVDFRSLDRLNHEFDVYGRLKAGVTVEQADAELKSVAAQIWQEFPQLERGWSAHLVPFDREIVGDSIRTGLFVLLGAVGVLLAIACANLSNLMLVRASGRAHELAVRTALGANRWQIIQQLALEALVISGIGGALGVLCASWAIAFLHQLPLPRAAEITLDLRVLAVACVATALTALLASVGPGLRACRAKPQDALKSRSSRISGGSRGRDAMVVAQIALSLALLIGAALLARSFLKLLRVDPGFKTGQVLTLALRPQGNNARVIPLYNEIVDRVGALPGVAAVGTTSTIPLSSNNTSLNVFPIGLAAIPADQSIQADWRLVLGDYFNAMRIPLLRGKSFVGLSPEEARRSVVISASLAQSLFGNADPIGREIRPGFNNYTLRVIGVVGDVRTHSLGTPPVPAFYWSLHRFTYGSQKLVVRTTGDMAPLVAGIRDIVRQIDPGAPVFWIRPLAEYRAESLEQERLLLGLLGAFAAIALLLAAIGTYGVIGFSVSQRTQEFGVRLAIGAQAADIFKLVLGQGARLVLGGIALGIAAAFIAVRGLSSLLYDTETSDPLSFLIGTAVLAFAALLASFLPARRATRVDPVVALRAE
jgi:putative ABC transport system permease protein